MTIILLCFAVSKRCTLKSSRYVSKLFLENKFFLCCQKKKFGLFFDEYENSTKNIFLIFSFLKLIDMSYFLRRISGCVWRIFFKTYRRQICILVDALFFVLWRSDQSYMILDCVQSKLHTTAYHISYILFSNSFVFPLISWRLQNKTFETLPSCKIRSSRLKKQKMN